MSRFEMEPTDQKAVGQPLIEGEERHSVNDHERSAGIVGVVVYNWSAAREASVVDISSG